MGGKTIKSSFFVCTRSFLIVTQQPRQLRKQKNLKKWKTYSFDLIIVAFSSQY